MVLFRAHMLIHPLIREIEFSFAIVMMETWSHNRVNFSIMFITMF